MKTVAEMAAGAPAAAPQAALATQASQAARATAEAGAVPTARAVPEVPGVRRGLHVEDQPSTWRLSALAGRFAEVSGNQASASMTFAVRLVFEAQTLGEPAAWIAVQDRRARSVFFPPDVADAGVDLSALAVVRAGDAIRAAKVADHLLRSGAFGLLVLDLGNGGLPIPIQTRLGGLAKKHDAALLCLTEKDAERPSLGSLVSLRAQAHKLKVGDRYRCEVHVLKDKRRGPGFKQVELCRGPAGLC